MNEAFIRDLESHHAEIFRYIYRMIGDWEEAKDLTQEAFTRWAADGRPLIGQDANRRWLFVVARNLAFSHLRNQTRNRRRASNGQADSPPHVATPRELESAGETAELVARAVEALPPDLREIVVLREYESMTYAEIAHITGAAPGTVKSRLARARVLLRKKLSVLLEVK